MAPSGCFAIRPALLRRAAVTGVIAVVILAAGAAAATGGDPTHNAQIERLRDELERQREEQDSQRVQLQSVERRIVALKQSLREAHARGRDLATQQARLQERRLALESSLSTQRATVAALIRAAHALSRDGYLQILLSQGDPARVGRALSYSRYLANARAERLRALGQTATELAALDAELESARTELEALQQRLEGENTDLERARAERTRVLAGLRDRIRDKHRELERLRADQDRLGRFAEGLQAGLAQGASAPPPEPSPETGLEGVGQALALPVAARVRARYGQPKLGEELRWNGLLLAAAEGEPVHAVYRGRVVYSDWFRGFGLLLIVDHGGGYMSLYGHNGLLLKQPGEWVETGEPIAQVGTTGGLGEPGLYFEIRHQGEPRDPLIWCRLD